MASAWRQVSTWWLTLAVAIGIFLPIAFFPYGPVFLAADLKELSVTETGGEFSLKVVSVLDAPSDYVYDVITDYKNAYRINPAVIEVQILPSEQDDAIRVRNISEHKLGPLNFEIVWVGDIVEMGNGQISVTTLPDHCSFESGSAVWKVRSRGEQAWVYHESTLKPKFFVPPLVGDFLMKKIMKNKARATFRKIECNAKLKLEKDMEDATDRLKTLLQQGEDCRDEMG